MILHTVNKPEALARCAPLVADGDMIVLLEDGVYAAADELPLTGVSVKAVEGDAAARGFASRLPKGIDLIGYRELVGLCASADRICNWF